MHFFILEAIKNMEAKIKEKGTEIGNFGRFQKV